MSRAPDDLPLAPPRLLAVDVFRGLTLVLMILVNNPGSWSAVYAPLLHAEWHGWTPTDLVFPFFLFIVGVSIVLALGWRLEAGADRRQLIAKILRRGTILVVLGLLLSGYPFGLFGPRSFERLLETWRIPGVLQRIGLCYTAAALLYLRLSESKEDRRPRGLIIWTAALLFGYWLLMTFVPVPGLEGQGLIPPDLDSRGGHLAGWLDRVVLGDHLWSMGKVYDPEGLLSTLPALATTLLGVLAGLVLTSRREPLERLVHLFVTGTLLMAGGIVWSWAMPVNKALWTPSYVVLTAGQAYCALGLCYWLYDLRGHRALARPLTTFGLNAITVFVGSGVLAKTLLYLEPGGRSVHSWIYQAAFTSWLPPYPASLAFAVTWVAGWFAVLAVMRRRGIVIKI